VEGELIDSQLLVDSQLQLVDSQLQLVDSQLLAARPYNDRATTCFAKRMLPDAP
jgi:hypothetical protein